MDILVLRALKATGYEIDTELTLEGNLRLAFQDYVDAGIFENLIDETDLEDLEIRDIAKAVLRYA